ncbi:hypothetical protein A3Q41_01564 [Rhodococcoides fascians]|uniref:Uncharacterized protein n=1 Tax=Rhodococcoides fascians TaxID=1828 RepID=A0A143QJB5_RHOFA|nr:hypothetical protein A3Q41_01564 [Rhodococcus fascians]
MTAGILHHRAQGHTVGQVGVGAVSQYVRPPILPSDHTEFPTLAEGIAENDGDLARLALPHDAEVGAVDLPALVGAVLRSRSGQLRDHLDVSDGRCHRRYRRRPGLRRSDRGCGRRGSRSSTGAGNGDGKGLGLRVDLDARERQMVCRAGGGRLRGVGEVGAGVRARVGRRFRLDTGVVRRRVGHRHEFDRRIRHGDHHTIRQRRQLRRIAGPDGLWWVVLGVESGFSTGIHRRRRGRVRGGCGKNGCTCGNRDDAAERRRAAMHAVPPCCPTKPSGPIRQDTPRQRGARLVLSIAATKPTA